MGIVHFIKMSVNRFGLAYVSFLNKREYDSQVFSGINERPVEYQFVFKQLASVCPQKVLDVGSGTTALPHLMRNCGFLVTAVDNIRDYWPTGMQNRHYHVIDDDITHTRLQDSFDCITCISVLEHIRDHRAAVRAMFHLLKPGGRLILTFPYNERQYCENVYALPDSTVKERFSFSTQAFSRNEVDAWLKDNDGLLLEQDYWQFFSKEYWTCGERVCPPIMADKDRKHQISCIVMQKRA